MYSTHSYSNAGQQSSPTTSTQANTYQKGVVALTNAANYYRKYQQVGDNAHSRCSASAKGATISFEFGLILLAQQALSSKGSAGIQDFRNLHLSLAAYEYGHYCFNEAMNEVRGVLVCSCCSTRRHLVTRGSQNPPFVQVAGSASGIIMTQIDSSDRAIAKILGIMKADSYATLCCPRFSSPKIVRKAYLQLARKYHPDKNQHSKRLFVAIQEAYELLTDAAKKAAYDTRLRGSAASTRASAGFPSTGAKYGSSVPGSASGYSGSGMYSPAGFGSSGFGSGFGSRPKPPNRAASAGPAASRSRGYNPYTGGGTAQNSASAGTSSSTRPATATGASSSSYSSGRAAAEAAMAAARKHQADTARQSEFVGCYLSQFWPRHACRLCKAWVNEI